MRPHRTFGKSPATCVSLYALSKTSSRNLETPSWFEEVEELISDNQNAARNLIFFFFTYMTIIQTLSFSSCSVSCSFTMMSL